MAAATRANLDDPMVKKLIELVSDVVGRSRQVPGAAARRPLPSPRARPRGAVRHQRTTTTWYEGAVRVQPFEAPHTLNRSWSMTATIEVPEGGATGPIAAIGGDSSGWSLYLNDGVPTFCYNFPGPEYTYIRADRAAHAGPPRDRRSSSRRPAPSPSAPAASGASTVDGAQVAEGEIPRTCAVGYSMDETFDIGWDKGSPVSEDYGPIAAFTGTIVKVDFDAQARPPPRPRRTRGHRARPPRAHPGLSGAVHCRNEGTGGHFLTGPASRPR